MKSIFVIALAVAFSAYSISAYAQTSQTAPKPGAAAAAQKTGATAPKRMHDRCHSRAAQMSGKPC
jgi:hypothetical protein